MKSECQKHRLKYDRSIGCLRCRQEVVDEIQARTRVTSAREPEFDVERDIVNALESVKTVLEVWVRHTPSEKEGGYWLVRFFVVYSMFIADHQELVDKLILEYANRHRMKRMDFQFFRRTRENNDALSVGAMRIYQRHPPPVIVPS